jgi:hypothetical protein
MSILAVSLAALGLLFCALAVHRLRRRRLLAASGHGLAGGVLLAIAAALVGIAINLQTYARLTHEQPVARINFSRLAPHRFEATLTYRSGRRDAHVLMGDEWQLDARVLKWTGLATVLGLDTRYRLERLSGRFHDLKRERDGPRSVYPLARVRGLDLWSLAQGYERWLPWVDATYGTATYLPMADGASYGVHLTAAGLVGRPLNPAARAALRGWP